MIIYKIKNLINQKIYIGQTTKPLQYRINQHLKDALSGSNTYFHNSIRKYGIENFESAVICRATNIEELNQREEFCIRIYKSLSPNGYNLAKGGKNREILETTRLKMSKAKIGIAPYNKGKNWEILYGIEKSNEMKKHFSKVRIGSTPPNKGKTLEEQHGYEKSKEIKEKHSKWKRDFAPWNKGLKGKDHPNYGKCPLNSEQIQFLSESRKGSGNPMYGKSPPNKGIACTQEVKEKISKANKGRQSPMKGKKHSQETLVKLKQANHNQKAIIRNDGKKYSFIEDAAKDMGCSRHTIKRACIDHPAYLRPYKGYTFKNQ